MDKGGKTLNQAIKKALKQEESLRVTIAKMKETIFNDVSASKPLDGVDIKKCSVSCAVVSFSTLSHHGLIMSPYYYLPSAQAEFVRRRLQSATTVTDIINRIREMTDERKVRFSSSETHPLNPNTIEVLSHYI